MQKAKRQRKSKIINEYTNQFQINECTNQYKYTNEGREYVNVYHFLFVNS